MVRPVSLHPQTGGMCEPGVQAQTVPLTRSKARLETGIHCTLLGALHKGSGRY